MKNIVLLILFSFSILSLGYAQNMIYNPSFEDGTTVTGPMQVDHATYWDQGCGKVYYGFQGEYFFANSADLFDYYSTDCDYETPDNKWASNLWPHHGRRYVAFSGNSNTTNMQHPDYAYGESVIGDLRRPVGDDCYYRLSFWAAAEVEISYNCVDYFDRTPHSQLRVQVALRKTGDCELEKIVYTSPILSSGTWVNFQGGFFLDPEDYDVGYDQIEFRIPLLEDYEPGRVKAVFIDNTSLTRYQVGQLDPSFDLSIQTLGNHYSVTATAPPLPSAVGLGYFWAVEELDNFGNPIPSASMINPSIWWTGGTYNNFHQYCCYEDDYNSYGHFEFGKTYRITRGLWANCYTWNSDSYTVYLGRRDNGEVYQRIEPVSEEENEALLRKWEQEGAILPQPTISIPEANEVVNKEVKEKAEVNIFPNPTNGQFSLVLDKKLAETTQRIRIVNLLGQEIQSIDTQNMERLEIDLNGHAKGVYYIQIITPEQRITKNIILQ